MEKSDPTMAADHRKDGERQTPPAQKFAPKLAAIAAAFADVNPSSIRTASAAS